jgi:hypothetical protein
LFVGKSVSLPTRQFICQRAVVEIMALTELEVKKAKAKDKQQKLADSSELYLLIHPNGSKC